MTALPEISRFHKGMKEVFNPYTCEAVSTHLTLTVCEEHDDRAEKYVIESFPSSCAGLRVAFKSPAREGRDTRRLPACWKFVSSKTQDEGTGLVGVRDGACAVCSPICLSIFAISCESVMKAMIRIGYPIFSS